LLTLLFLDTTSCSTAKGGCPHICLPQGGGKKCVCADHYNYTASDNTCTLMPTKGKSSISLFFKKKLAARFAANLIPQEFGQYALIRNIDLLKIWRQIISWCQTTIWMTINSST